MWYGWIKTGGMVASIHALNSHFKVLLIFYGFAMVSDDTLAPLLQEVV